MKNKYLTKIVNNKYMKYAYLFEVTNLTIVIESRYKVDLLDLVSN